MPQNPVQSTLLVTKLKSGAGVSLTPSGGTGIVTVAVTTPVPAVPGTFTLNGATPVSVTDAAVTANSAIIITLKTVGGTVGAQPHVETITAGTGFTVVGTASDTSIYNYTVIG